MQSEVIARLKAAIADAEADMENDYAAAATTGERVDLYDYGVSISLEDAKVIDTVLTAARHTSPPMLGEDNAVEAMVSSLRDPFPSESLMRAGGIDYWRDIMRSAYRSALSAQVQDVATHRHKKRGTQYVLIGVGKMQVENWCEFTTEVNHAEGREYAFAGKAVDMREVAIYRSVDDGSLWVRPVEEFNDGRFEPLPSAPAKQEGSK